VQQVSAPSSRESEGNHKSQSNEPLRNGILAPGLEHGDHSNKEEYDCEDGKNFHD